MPQFRLSPEQLQAYQRDGYVLVPQLFTAEQVRAMHEVAKADRAIAQAHVMADGSGAGSKIWLDVELKENTYSAFSHSQRVLGPVAQLLGEDGLFYHHKMMLKEPRVGGAWEWHQDYGYWYNDGFLYPNLISCMIAVDRASQANGCLQVLKGSHHLGRIEHGKVGAQTGANVERVEQVKQRLELVYCAMEPGTGLFFHCNLLHASAQNKSEMARWSFISCYTAASNRSVQEEARPFTRCKVVEPWPDARLEEIAQRHLQALQTANQ